MNRTLVVIAIVVAACITAKLVLITLLISGLFAVTLSPVVAGLRRLHLPQALGAFLVVAGVIAALVAIGNSSYQRVAEFTHTMPANTHEARKLVTRIAKPIGMLPSDKDNLAASSARSAPWVDLLKGVGTLTEVLVALTFIPFIVYFWLSWKSQLFEKTVRLFPKTKQESARTALIDIGRMLRRFIIGNVLLGIAMSAMLLPLFFILHVPFTIEVALATGFLSLIPYLGILIAPFLPLIASLSTLDAVRALIIVGAVATTHLVALNVIYPKLIGRSLKLNPLAASVALLVWGWLWGPLGLVLAIPITAGIKIAFEKIPRLCPYGVWLGTE